jgi:hypothetical protein
MSRNKSSAECLIYEITMGRGVAELHDDHKDSSERRKRGNVLSYKSDAPQKISGDLEQIRTKIYTIIRKDLKD